MWANRGRRSWQSEFMAKVATSNLVELVGANTTDWNSISMHLNRILWQLIDGKSNC
jgi:hypothetical protein